MYLISLKIELIKEAFDTFNRLLNRLMRFLDAIGILTALSGFIILLYHIGFNHRLADLLFN